MQNWAEKLKEVQKYEKDVSTVLVAANNHYAGYGPETSNIFREMLGLKRVEWGDEKEISRKVQFEEVNGSTGRSKRIMKQTSLFDFMSKS